MKTGLVVTLLILLVAINRSPIDEIYSQQEQEIMKNMKLKITFGETALTATIYDNPTTKDLISMLPLTTELEDYANNEKIFYPERKLTRDGAPDGYAPKRGDITYYAPWGDVAIFYKDFNYSSGLISLGRIDDEGIEKLTKVGKQPVVFELIGD